MMNESVAVWDKPPVDQSINLRSIDTYLFHQSFTNRHSVGLSSDSNSTCLSTSTLSNKNIQTYNERERERERVKF